MEESCEMHSEDDKALSEKNRKRTVKTREQIEALEKFYDEHKYPTESLKIEVAKRIGLTEKQVSSWFCHRRLKDKKLLQGEMHINGRQDRSSGVIQDLGSGLRQDSCGSTKQADEKNYDPREVESRRLAGMDLSAADQTYEYGSHYIGSFNRMDDTSSGSNSSLRNMHFKGDPADMATSRYGAPNLSVNAKGGKTRSGPSGYLKLKAPPENPAIASVKRQLGRHYREDGPPLGIEFDPLPPGAFESSDPVDDYVEEHVQRHSPDVPKVHQEHISKLYHTEEHRFPPAVNASKIRKQPTSGTVYRHIPRIGSHSSDLDGKQYKVMHGSDHSENFSSQNSGQKVSSYKHRSMDVSDCSAREVASFDSRCKEMRGMSGMGGFRTDSVDGHHNQEPCGTERSQKRARPWLPNDNDKVRKVGQGDRFSSNPSDLTKRGWQDNILRDNGLTRKVAKVDKIYAQRRIVGNDRDEVIANIPPKNEMRRAKIEFPDQQYADMPQWSNHHVKRPAVDMPSSFSEDDETAGTSSSDD